MARRILPVLCAAIVGCSEASVETQGPPKDAADTDRVESFRSGDATRPDARLFAAHGGIQTLPEIHAKYVDEFISVPNAFGFGRMPYRGPSTTPDWVEYVPASGSETVSTRTTTPVFDSIEHTITLPDGTRFSTRETVWQVQERLLVSTQRETPDVYKELSPFAATMHAQASARKPDAKRPETRPTDEFEAAAIEKLKVGQDLLVKTEPHEMRLVGAIRAKAECLACHSTAKAGDLLGAFTYKLAPLSFATKPEQQVKNLEALSAEQRAAVEALEAVGGVFTQDAKGAITAASFGISRHQSAFGFASLPAPVRNEDLAWIANLPDLKELDLRYCHIGDRGLKELEKATGLRKIDLSFAQPSQAAVDSLKKALPQCEIVYGAHALP
jgi:hypothetical protein